MQRGKEEPEFMKTLRVNIPGYEYDIVIGKGVLHHAADYFENKKKYNL